MSDAGTGGISALEALSPDDVSISDVIQRVTSRSGPPTPGLVPSSPLLASVLSKKSPSTLSLGMDLDALHFRRRRSSISVIDSSLLDEGPVLSSAKTGVR